MSRESVISRSETVVADDSGCLAALRAASEESDYVTEVWVRSPSSGNRRTLVRQRHYGGITRFAAVGSSRQ